MGLISPVRLSLVHKTTLHVLKYVSLDPPPPIHAQTRLPLNSHPLQLLYLGRDWPQGYDYFCTRTKSVFRKNSLETNPQKIRELIDRGNYVTKEIEALYKLKKYRTLKRRYYS